MSTLNPGLHPIASKRHAASLIKTVSWRLRRAWQAMEVLGRRRAAPELLRAAERLAAHDRNTAIELAALAHRWRAQ